MGRASARDRLISTLRKRRDNVETYDADGCAEGVWGKVGAELGLDDADIAVWARDAAAR
jgi:hypothetical protein